MSLIAKSYEELDSAVMKGINVGVRAYNWTIGGTKKDLANNLLTAAPIAEASGFIGITYTPRYTVGIGVIMSGLYMFLSHINQKTNEETEMLEQKALENSCLDSRVELRKETAAVMGPFFACLGGIQGLVGILESSNGDYLPDYFYLIVAGYLIRSSSYYVMRADYLPPRKNCFKRDLEKLAEFAENYKTKPCLELVPAQS